MEESNNLLDTITALSQRVYTSIGPGHNESIYQKALFYDLANYGLNMQLEKHVDVTYEDTKGNIHHLVSERIDIFIYKDVNSKFKELQTKNVILELKALSRPTNRIEDMQVQKYFRELGKQKVPVEYGLVINFPQPSIKNNTELIEIKLINNTE